MRQIINNHLVVITYDPEPLHPRDDYDNLGTMVCWNSRYRLGDEQPSCDPQEWWKEKMTIGEQVLMERIGELIDSVWDYYNARPIAVKEKTLSRLTKIRDELMNQVEERYVVLPLYLYDHSGLTISTNPFACYWDSGQIGFIYAEKGCEGMSDEQLEAHLRSEVEEYDAYLTGQVYCCLVYRFEGCDMEDIDVDEIDTDDLELVESCYGFASEKEALEFGLEVAGHTEEHA